MVDAVNLLFIRKREQFLIQGASAFQIMPKRLFHDDSPPLMVNLLHQLSFGEVLHNRAERIRVGGEIEEIVAVRGESLIDFR